MDMDHKNFMHDAALVAVADAAESTALSKASSKHGRYVVNHDRNLAEPPEAFEVEADEPKDHIGLSDETAW